MAVVDDIANVREALAADSESASVPGSFVRNIITKYEFNQVLSLRTLHLSKGAPPLIEIPKDFKIRGNMELRAVALREILEGRLPYLVKRVMPNGKTEYRKLAELDMSAVRHLMR
jgi:DNA-directed RNA polymerase subunit K/omega